MLAETGYHGYFTVLQRNGLMPGQVKGIQLLKQDESRHIAYGIYLISRLIAADDRLWQVAEDTMNELLPLALDVIGDVFTPYDPVPFGLSAIRLHRFCDQPVPETDGPAGARARRIAGGDRPGDVGGDRAGTTVET